jgi:hypothetical protein
MGFPDPAVEIARLLTELTNLEHELQTMNPRDSEGYDAQLEKVRALRADVRKFQDQQHGREST